MKAGVVALLAIVAMVESNVSRIWKCENVSRNACNVRRLRITPCGGNPCRLKAGQFISTVVDYTPYFSANKMTMALYLVRNDGSEVLIDSMGFLDASQYTKLPVDSGKPSTLSYDMTVPWELIFGNIFTFKWKLWNNDNSDQVCCLETRATFYQ